MPLSEANENYLKTILLLQMRKGAVRAIDVAEYMGVSKPSVSTALKLLCRKAYVVRDAGHFLHLTEDGKRIAQNVLDRNQFFENKLIIAGVEPKLAAQEACKLEHAISQATFNIITQEK